MLNILKIGKFLLPLLGTCLVTALCANDVVLPEKLEDKKEEYSALNMILQHNATEANMDLADYIRKLLVAPSTKDIVLDFSALDSDFDSDAEENDSPASGPSPSEYLSLLDRTQSSLSRFSDPLSDSSSDRSSCGTDQEEEDEKEKEENKEGDVLADVTAAAAASSYFKPILGPAYAGIDNLGLTCFLNSVFKTMAFNPELDLLTDPTINPLTLDPKENAELFTLRQETQVLLGQLFREIRRQNYNQGPFAISKNRHKLNLGKLVQQFLKNFKKIQKLQVRLDLRTPQQVMDTPGMEHDAGEFALLVLDLLDAHRAGVGVPVININTQEGTAPSLSTERYSALNVGVRKYVDDFGKTAAVTSLQSAVDDYFAPEIYAGDGSVRPGRLQKYLLGYPPLLQIGLQRLVIMDKKKIKIKHAVHVADEIAFPVADSRGEFIGTAIYSPSSTIIHHGGAYGGHYTAAIKHTTTAAAASHQLVHHDDDETSFIDDEDFQNFLDYSYIVFLQFKAFRPAAP